MIMIIITTIMIMIITDLFHTASWPLQPPSHRHSPAAVQLRVCNHDDDGDDGDVGDGEEDHNDDGDDQDVEDKIGDNQIKIVR